MKRDSDEINLKRAPLVVASSFLKQSFNSWLCLGAVFFAAPSFACAQSEGTSLGPFQITHETDLDVVFALGNNYASQDTPYLDARLGLTAEAITQSGLRWGANFTVQARRDNGREGFRTYLGEDGTALEGALTGYHTAQVPLDRDGRIALETAEVFLKTQKGHVYLGQGSGAAQREFETLPGAFRLMRADQGLVDPSGLAGVTTRNTLSGQGPKLTYQSQRLLGFRVSGSYTPKSDQCGLTVCRKAVELDHVKELAASFDYTLRSQDLRIYAAVSGAWADHNQSAILRQDPWVYSGQLTLEHKDWAWGIAHLTTNDGLNPGRYEAWSSSVSYTQGDWVYALEWASSTHQTWHMDSESWQVGASRWFEPGILLGLGVLHTAQDRELSLVNQDNNRDVTQVFIESGLRF